MLTFVKTPLEGACLIEKKPFTDERGSFSRLFCSEVFERHGLSAEFVQINLSRTEHKGTIRGMHAQLAPYSEAKVVTCLKGKVFDVMVDLRKGSKTFLHWFGIELDETSVRSVYIPAGFAHGFQTLTDHCELLYFHDKHYQPDAEFCVRFDDQKIAIEWPLLPINVSVKDQNYPQLDDHFQGIII